MFFRKKKNETFKTRVENFWTWWEEHSQRILDDVSAEGGREIQSEISKQVEKLGPSFAWEFGPNTEGEGHSFTLSPEGILNTLFLTSFWKRMAPELKGWQFHSSRQASEGFAEHTLKMEETELSAKEIWISATPDLSTKELDLVVWTPIFAEISNEIQWRIVFVLLDDALGETGVMQWIGEVKVNDTALERSFPLSELPEQLEVTQKENSWETPSIDQCSTLFKFKELDEQAVRGDLFTLNTRNPSIAMEYRRERGKIENPIPDTGAEYIYVSFSSGLLPKGKEVDFRAEIEDDLEAELKEAMAGTVLGGGLGNQLCYIDILNTDGAEATAIIKKVFERHEVYKFEVRRFCK